MTPAKKKSNKIIHDIEEIISNTINPILKIDNGNIEFISFNNGLVEISLHGSCLGCPGSPYTIKYLVEPILRKKINSINGVIIKDWQPLIPSYLNEQIEKSKK